MTKSTSYLYVATSPDGAGITYFSSEDHGPEAQILARCVPARLAFRGWTAAGVYPLGFSIPLTRSQIALPARRVEV